MDKTVKNICSMLWIKMSTKKNICFVLILKKKKALEQMVIIKKLSFDWQGCALDGVR